MLRFSFNFFLLFLHFKSLIEILNLFGKSSIPKPLRCRVLNFFGDLCHCWCPPFSAGHIAFLLICFPGLSLLVSAHFRWPCSISVPAGVRPFPLAVAFLFICLLGLSLLVSALFCWPCNISIHLSPRSVTAGVRPFPLAM